MRLKRKIKCRRDRHKKMISILLFTLILPATSILVGYLISLFVVTPTLAK